MKQFNEPLNYGARDARAVCFLQFLGISSFLEDNIPVLF